MKAGSPNHSSSKLREKRKRVRERRQKQRREEEERKSLRAAIIKQVTDDLSAHDEFKAVWEYQGWRSKGDDNEQQT